MKKLLYIYNPAAGRKTAKASLSDVLEVFARQGYEITVHPTQGRGDATRTVLEDGGGFDRVVCCGGDGTLNETVQGLLALPKDRRPVLGYIPAGTTNDFSRTLELPRTLPELAETAGEGVPRLIDVGQAEGRPFTYVAAFGLFTDVSYSTSQASKNLLGHFAYVLEGMGKLSNIPSYHMKVTTGDGREMEGDFIYGMVGNTVSVGGLVNLPRDKVRLDDGRFEVILIRRPENGRDWQSILTALTTATGLAWKSGVAAEVLCLPEPSLGQRIYYTKYYLDIPELFAWTAVTVALSMVLERLLRACVARWGRGWGR